MLHRKENLRSYEVINQDLQKELRPVKEGLLQGHIMCFDELEICGWYMNDREQFKKHADSDAMINTSPNMRIIIDTYYHKKFELGELNMR